jgi:hypothetical protein
LLLEAALAVDNWQAQPMIPALALTPAAAWARGGKRSSLPLEQEARDKKCSMRLFGITNRCALRCMR